MPKLLAALLLTILLAGCLLDIKTHGFGSPTAPSPSSQAAPTQPPPATPAPPAAAAATPAAPIKTGHMVGVVSKDEQGPVRRGEIEAFVAACFADFDDMRARWAPYEAKYRARFAEIQRLSYYEQRAALTELKRAYLADIKDAKLDAGSTGEFLARGGFAYEVDAYLVELHRKRGITRDVRLFDPKYSPFRNDDAAADVYCSLGSTHRTPEPRFSFDYETMLPESRAEALRAYKQENKHVLARTLKVDPPKREPYKGSAIETSVPHGGDLPVGAPVDIVGVVEGIERDAKGVQIRASIDGTWKIQYGCVDTDRIKGFDGNGAPVYHDHCNSASSKYKLTYVVALPDAPADVRKGDYLAMDGTVQKVTRSRSDPTTGLAYQTTIAIKGTFVHGVARADKPGQTYEDFPWIETY